MLIITKMLDWACAHISGQLESIGHVCFINVTLISGPKNDGLQCYGPGNLA